MTTTPSAVVATLHDENALVREHLPLVRRAVAELSAKMPRHAAREDLMSAGMAGLAQAARNFDESRGVPFHRYAATRIKGALLDELRANDWASRPVRAKARRMDQATERLVAKLGRTPTRAEVAQEMGVDTAAVRGLATDVHRATVLNYESILDGETDAFLPSGNDNPELELLDRERSAYLVDAVRSLPPRLQTVVVGSSSTSAPCRTSGPSWGSVSQGCRNSAVRPSTSCATG